MVEYLSTPPASSSSAARAAQDYRERTVAQLQDTLAPEAVRRVEEQRWGACTIEVAAFDGFTALLTDPTLDVRVSSTGKFWGLHGLDDNHSRREWPREPPRGV